MEETEYSVGEKKKQKIMSNMEFSASQHILENVWWDGSQNRR